MTDSWIPFWCFLAWAIFSIAMAISDTIKMRRAIARADRLMDKHEQHSKEES